MAILGPGFGPCCFYLHASRKRQTRHLRGSIPDFGPLNLLPKSHQWLDVVVPPACSFFTFRMNPFVQARSARLWSGQRGSTKVLSGWHKLYRTHRRTQAAKRIGGHNCHPGRRSKMLMWRIGAPFCRARVFKGAQTEDGLV